MIMLAGFLLIVIKRKGFKFCFRKRILDCLKTASDAVLLTGGWMLVYRIETSRQQDPLSPFHFLVVSIR